MSTSTTSLSDSLPSSVPKLDATGLNWAIFSVRFQDAIEAKGFWGHFDGSKPRPPVVTVTAEDGTTTTTGETEEAQWLKDERSAKSLLTQKIPDLTLMRVYAKATIKDRWDAIKVEYTEKGAYAQTELCAKFLDSKCPDKGNVREFLGGLRVKKEELTKVGVDIDNKDYLSTIITSLPLWLSSFASAQLASARMFAESRTIDPDVLIGLLIKEADRQKAQRACRHGGGKSKEEDRDEAMSMVPSKGKGKAKGGGGKKKDHIECWTCGEKGHYQNKCPKADSSEKGKKKAKDSLKQSGSANAAETDDEEEGAWAAEESDAETTSHASMPSLQTRTTSSDTSNGDFYSDKSSDDNGDRFSEVAEDTDEYNDSEWELDNIPGSPSDDYKFIEQEALVATEPARPGQYAYHISPYHEQFKTFEEIPPKTFRAANKQSFSATGRGEMVIDIPDGVNSLQLRLTEVLYSPERRLAAESVSYAVQKANSKGLYRVKHELDSANAAVEALTLDQLHHQLGHISPRITQKLVNDKFVTGMCLEHTVSGEPFFCESCVYAKATRKSVPKEREGERVAEFGGEVHSDLWGPAPVESKGSKRYYITFTDDKTHLTNLYLLHKKDEAFTAYKGYEAWCGTQLNAHVKVLHSDRGGEYLGKEFTLHLKSKGTEQKLNVHDTPQHNGVAEQRNRTIAERIRALLHSSGLPKSLWGKAARHVIWLMNRTLTKAISGMTPYKAAFGRKPNLRHVREWGKRVWVRIEGGTKLGGRVREGRWMGVDKQSKGVWVYWPDTKTVSVEQNVYYDETCKSGSHLEGEEWDGFNETKPDLSINLTAEPPPSTSSTSNQTAQPAASAPQAPERDESASEPDETPSTPKPREKRVQKPSQHVLDIIEGRAVSSNLPKSPKLSPGVQVPTEMLKEQVLEGEGTSDWMMAADFVDEYALVAEISKTGIGTSRCEGVLKAAGTWELMDTPDGVNIVGSKWVFRVKKDAAGNVVRYKARLVAQGFSQVPGVDYFDMFVPVARLASIRAVLAIVAVNDFEIHQIDIKGAYLNGVLTSGKVIYMRQPPGVLPPRKGVPGRVPPASDIEEDIAEVGYRIIKESADYNEQDDEIVQEQLTSNIHKNPPRAGRRNPAKTLQTQENQSDQSSEAHILTQSAAANVVSINTMSSDPSKMPTPGSKKSPDWKGKVEELLEFFEDFEELAKVASLKDEEKMKWVLKYVAEKSTRKFWKSLDAYSATLKDWAAFKKEVLEQYPGAEEGEAYTVRDLEKLTKATAEKRINTEEHFMKYYSHFKPMAKFLVAKNKISTLDSNRYFWNGLPKATRKLIKQRLDMTDAARDVKVMPSVENVVKAARRVLGEDALDSDSDDPIPVRGRRSKKSKRRRSKSNSSSSDSSSDGDASANDSSDSDSDSDDGVKKKRKGKERTRKVEVKEKVGEEVERLTKKLHGLKVGDVNYAATYIELVRLAPIAASVIPKPTSSVWGQTENQTSTSGVNTVQAPLAPPRRKPCYFCNNYGHVLRACHWVEDYVAAKRVVWKDNLLYFPDERGGQAVEFNQQGLKVVVDKAFGGQLERARDRPPHMATTSFVAVTPVSATFATMEEIYDSECKGEEEDEIALMEVFEELREAEAFVMTRGKAKELEKQKADEEKGTTGRKEKSAKVSSTTLEKAFTYESAAADPDAASKMYDRIMKTPIHDMTVGDLVSLSGDLRKRIVEQCRTTKTPVTVNATAATMSVQSIPLEYCTPLREVAVRVAAKVDERALLDDGSEIVVMRRDLWEETRHKVNMRRNMMMETANGDLEKMEGCAEFIEVEVNGLKTWVHAFVVPQAPFRLLLGRPWQKSVLLLKAEFEDGRLHVTIHSPLDRSKKCVVETKERESSGGKGQTLMFRSREDVLEAWRRWREGGCGNGLEEEPEGGEEVNILRKASSMAYTVCSVVSPHQMLGDSLQPPFPTSYANFILGTTFEGGPTAQTLAYKKVGRRIKPVSTTMPERAKVKCHFPEDPLATLPADLAWSEEEKGRFREDYIEPVVIPVIEHIPWFKKSPPFPPAVREKIKKVVEKKVASGVYEESTSSYQHTILSVNKKNGDIRIVHNLAPLNEVTIKDGSQLPIIDQYAELCSGRGVYSTLTRHLCWL
ncbi:unnamed protein product [Cyclocybe aegerita]|uniref:Uncharacterized protein n=1 Tax=Cyclocybe aegerita TaxID=1973307 RepID=A0A8S0WCT5_CYCAE|nr:unnamed protein product [Cyclocybe aegerita]